MRVTLRPLLGDYPRFARSLTSVGAVLGLIRHAATVRRQRRALLALDERMLADIGLSRSQAYREASRSLTDLPRL